MLSYLHPALVISMFYDSEAYSMTVKPWTLILGLVLGNTHFTSIASDVSFNYKKNQIMKTGDLNSQSFSFETIYCSSVIENGLSWPQTYPGFLAEPLEYCFKTDCRGITRTCNADSTWAPIIDTCEIQEESSVTPLLSVALHSQKFEVVYEISKNYILFKAVDVFLTKQLLQLYCMEIGNELSEVLCAGSFDNILNINKDVLMESQLKLCAVLDSLLFVLNYGYYNHLLQTTSKVESNFALLQSKSFEYASYGIIVLRVANKLTIEPIKNGILEEVVATENFEGALLVNSYNHINGDYVILYKVFFNDGLFQDEFRQSSETISKIFGKFEHDDQNVLIYPIHIVYPYDDSTFTNNVTCMYWNTNDRLRGFWSYSGLFQIFKSCFICSFWSGEDFAFSFTSPKDVTDTLTEILSSDFNSSDILSRLLQTSSRYEEFNSFDLFLVGEILKKVNENELQFLKINDGYNDIELLSRIISFLQKIDKGVLSESQNLYNATDSVLFYTDLIITNQEYQSNLQLISENFIILTIRMNTTDFAGFVLLDNNQVEILNSSVNNITELLQYENLDSAFILSPELKNQMNEDAVIIINIFFEDVFFNEKNQHLKYANVSKIYDVILPENTTFSGPIFLIYNNTNSYGLCSHWSYNFPEKVPGFWQNDSEGEDIFSLVQCDFWHTTHFAFLLLDDRAKYVEVDSSLSWITNVSLSLSLFGFFWILLTAFLFRTWREKNGNKILLNFVFSGISQIVIFFLSADYNKKEKVYCIFTGAILHFLVLSQFCWMMNIALLQFRRFVIVLGSYPQHILLKTCLFAWGFPLIPVISVLATNYNSYVSGNSGFCYPSGSALYLGVWLPICAIIFINCVIFLYVVHSVLYKKAQNVSFSGNESIYHWRLVIFLFFLLGLAWVFGFLAELDDGIVFVYLFDFLATLQGFVMFLFFILLNDNVRDLYRQKLRSCLENK